jgi:hypothetical protein
MLPEMLERKLGQMHMQARKELADSQVPVCPPVSPALLSHLEMMFKYPVDAKPGHPQLAQLLTIQYGVEKVLTYLRKHYDSQTEIARKAHAI